MKIKKTITQEVEITQTKVCDRCGARNERKPEGYFSSQPYIHSFYVEPGFNSKMDGKKIKFDLCDECLSNILSSFISTPPSLKENE